MDVADSLRLALADRYTIERELGQGGMATVYLAHDRKLGRAVALKVLRPELAAALGSDRFLREIEIAAKLAHPHILALHDCGEADGLLYYTMPFVDGESLRDRLSRERQLPLDDALRIAQEVADALGYAHALGLVHRDIKPENVLFEAGHAVVSDFGIARAVSAAGGTRLTETGLAIGTPAYMSPEQAAGSKDVDGRSDLYSLGCVLYEMLAGQPPFTGATSDSVVRQHLAAEPPSIMVVRPAVPAHVAAALQRALAKTPADRLATATQFAEALTASAAATPSPARRTRPRARRIDALVVGLLVVAAGVGVLHETGVLWPSRGPGGGPRLASLVVLPFKNLSGDTTQEYYADGMTDELITDLGEVAALTVISNHTAMTYKKKADMPLPAIARELHVQAVVEGSVVRSGGQVRIAARLIDGRTDRQLWDSSYQREASGALDLQAEVARTIAGAIGATLTPAETRRLAVHRPVNPQAYDEYLLGRHDELVETRESLGQAIAHYRRAIALDSSFADAHAGLSEAYQSLIVNLGMSPKEGDPLAKGEAERAVELDSGSALAHSVLGAVRQWLEWRWQDAGAEYRRALALNPNLWESENRYSQWLTALARHDEAIQHALRAVALDPLVPVPRASLAWTYFYARRFEESIAANEKALELGATPYFVHMTVGWAYSALGRHQEAIAAIARALREEPGDQVNLASAAVINARAGRAAVARGFLDSLLALGRKEWVDPYWFGWPYAWLGETDRALAFFSRAIDEHSAQVAFKDDWLPEAVKADPRYQALLRRAGLE